MNGILAELFEWKNQGGWIVLRARKKNAPPHAPPPPPPPFADQSFPPGPAPQEMYNDPYLPQNHMAYPPPPPLGPDPNAPPPAPIQEGSIPTGDPNAMPYMGGESHNTNQGLSQNPELTPFPPEEEHQDIQQDMSPRRERSHSKSRRRRASTGTRFEEDIDSYYSRSPTLRSRRHSYAGGGQSGLGYVLPPPAHPADDVPATSPISLWGPEEYRRRLEYQRRSRRRSLVQPSMQFDPHTGRYVEPAGRFVQRSSQVLPNLEEEEDEEAIGIRPLSLADPTLRQDGFANRTMVWKRLRRNSGIY